MGNDRSFLIMWGVPNQWVNATIENVYEVDGIHRAVLLIRRKRKQQKPFPLTSEAIANQGFVHYRFEFQLTLEQYAEYQGLQYADGRVQRWALPTVRGAQQAAWDYAKAHEHNPQKILGNTRKGKTPIKTPGDPAHQITHNVFWRIVYIKTGDGITAYWVDTDLKSIRANPSQAEWERTYRELPRLRVSVAEFNVQNWAQQRKQINQTVR